MFLFRNLNETIQFTKSYLVTVLLTFSWSVRESCLTHPGESSACRRIFLVVWQFKKSAVRVTHARSASNTAVFTSCVRVCDLIQLSEHNAIEFG